MKVYRWALFLILLAVAATPASASAQQRVIVRNKLGLPGIKTVCVILNCSATLNLGDPSGDLFLITSNSSIDVTLLLNLLVGQYGIVSAEPDQQLYLIGSTVGPIPESLLDDALVNYYGAPVWNGYVNQPGSLIVRVQQAQSTFDVTGTGTVAMIDTGVDTQHPALSSSLVQGYNFLNNTPSGDETGDINQSSAAVLDGGTPEPTYVNSSTIAVINQSSAAVLDGGGYSGFGHGTMTAGIVHMVAPTAQIMPLKAFGPDGSGYVSNIIRATYYAVQHGGKILSMSFSFATTSKEMAKAVTYANQHGVICVASVGNDGDDVQVYPAALPGVMGVASSTDYNTRSNFSNYGTDVWVAAPGEGIISTYPYGTYAAGWGTSFSAPYVSGTAALLVSLSPAIDQDDAAAAISHAGVASSDLGHGELDAFMALQSLSDPDDQK